MGCVQSSQKAAAAPTLLTTKAPHNVAGKSAKHTPLAPTDELGTASSPEGTSEKIDAPFVAEVGMHEPSMPEPLLPEFTFPKPPVDTINSLHSSVLASPPLPAMVSESFTSGHSGYSASTNFTFGYRNSPKPASCRSSPFVSGISDRSGTASRLVTLQEDAPLVNRKITSQGAEEVSLTDIPEYSMAPGHVAHGPREQLLAEVADIGGPSCSCSVTDMGVVEKAVHALVDAGEEAWGLVKTARSTRHSILEAVEETSEAGENQVATSRLQRPFKALDWSCASC